LRVAETSSRCADLDKNEKADTCDNHALESRDETQVKEIHVRGETRSHEEQTEDTHVLYRQVNSRHAEEHGVNDTQVKKTQELHRVNSIDVAKSCLPLKDLIHADSYTLSEEIDKNEKVYLLKQSELEQLKKMDEILEKNIKIDYEKVKLVKKMLPHEVILHLQQKDLDGRQL